MSFQGAKTAGIIGAGLSGLVTARTLLAQGMECTIFERCQELGGVWADGYAGFGVQVQKDLYEFPDWPLPSEYPDFTPGPVFCDYLAAPSFWCHVEDPLRNGGHRSSPASRGGRLAPHGVRRRRDASERLRSPGRLRRAVLESAPPAELLQPGRICRHYHSQFGLQIPRAGAEAEGRHSSPQRSALSRPAWRRHRPPRRPHRRRR
jgi:hypothetical protein